MDPPRPWADTPYRSIANQVQSTVMVETNDTKIRVHFLDWDGKIDCIDHIFKGTPFSYQCNGYPVKAYPGFGQLKYEIWLEKVVKDQMVNLDDIIFPCHRLLQIEVLDKARPRTEVVDVEQRE